MPESNNPHAELLWAYENSSLVNSMVVAGQPWQCIMAELARENQRLQDEIARLRSSRPSHHYIVLPPELARNHHPVINPNTPQ